MKKIIILISMLSLLLLTSCGLKEGSEQEEANESAEVEQAEQTLSVENTEKTEGKTEANLDNNKKDMVVNEGPVKAGDNIEVNYKGTLEDGTQFDSSYDRGQTLPFTVGTGQMIKGFDEAVVGMKVGEKKTITLEPKDAYGEYDATKKQVVKKADLASFTAAGIELKVGEELPTQAGPLKIIEVSDDTVTLDVNHPLAGKALTFEIELVKIK